MLERRTDLLLNEFGRQRQGLTTESGSGPVEQVALSTEEINLAYKGVLSELARAQAYMAEGPSDRFDDEVYHFEGHMRGMKVFAEMVLGLDHKDYAQNLIQIGRESLSASEESSEGFSVIQEPKPAREAALNEDPIGRIYYAPGRYYDAHIDHYGNITGIVE